MASWRRLQAQREARGRWQERGTDALCWIIGGGIGGALVVLGIWCFHAAAIPIASRMGVIWISDHRKTGMAVLAVALGAALHFGMVWPRVPYLRDAWLPGLVLSLGAALAGGFLLM